MPKFTCGVFDAADLLVGFIAGETFPGKVVFAHGDRDGGENILSRDVTLLHEGVLAVLNLKQSVSTTIEFDILLKIQGDSSGEKLYFVEEGLAAQFS